jgi:membrane-associated protease RseP (regulator of RpoE activity)
MSEPFPSEGQPVFDGPQYVVSLTAVTQMRQAMTPYFSVTHTGLDLPQPGYVQFHGRYQQDATHGFPHIQKQFAPYGFTPVARLEADGRIVITAEPYVEIPKPSDWRINAILFVITVLATLATGALYGAESLEEGLQLWRGWPFSLSIMLILGAHEMGHYLAARHHNVAVTLPYFIPLPLLSPIGTMGAFIRLKERVPTRAALLDIGAAGPLAGFVLAVPILFIGLYTSEVGPISTTGLLEGNSILYAAAKFIVFGQFLPSATQDVYINQVAWAGWVGLLVTAINLIPLGQLDGGHVTYALWGQKTEHFFLPVIACMAVLSVISFLVGGALTWVVWLGLLFLVGRVHAEPLEDVTPLNGRRRVIAIATLVIFVLVFVPIPFQILGS